MLHAITWCERAYDPYLFKSSRSGVVTQFQFYQFMRENIPLLCEEGNIPRKPKLPIFELSHYPIWSGSFCRDSTPNGRDRPPSRDRQFMDFFHGRQSPICPNHKLCGIPQLRIVSRVHARRLYAGHLSTLCAKTHRHGAINGSGQGDCYPL